MTDLVDRSYSLIRSRFGDAARRLVPRVRRLGRFVALPYAYFWLVNWEECTRTRWKVLGDFLYIFFVLKDFPDYYTVFRLWEKDRREWAFYYGSTYNPYQKGRLQREVQRPEYEILFADKYVCHQLLSAEALPVPKLLGYLAPHAKSGEELRGLIDRSDSDKLIVKPSRGKGGKGVVLIERDGHTIRVRARDGVLALDDFRITEPMVVQEYVTQHSTLAEIARSVNTIRIETLLTKCDEVLFLGAFIRFGLGPSPVDNQSSGGLSVGVDLSTGRLFETAMDGRGVRFLSHPGSQVTFADVTVPFWHDVIAVAERLQRCFPYYRLLGPDIAVTNEGPVIIEVNATPDHAGLEMDFGPTFKSRKAWLAFKEYDLLINEPSRALYDFDAPQRG